MSLLIKPLLSEKSTQLATLGQYSFWVVRQASKLALKKEIESKYGVRIQSVNTLTLPPRRKRRYAQNKVIQGFKSRYKKAVVTLQEGDIIDFYAE